MKALFSPLTFCHARHQCSRFFPLQTTYRHRTRGTLSFQLRTTKVNTSFIISGPRVTTRGLGTNPLCLTYERNSPESNVLDEHGSESNSSNPVTTKSCGDHKDDEINGSGEKVEDYDFEELLQSIREKSFDRQKKMVHKVKRDASRMMTIEELTKFLEAENAEDVCVIRVPPEKRYVDYLVVCSGSSTRHIRGMADALASEMRHVRITGDFITKTDHRRVVVEGRECEDWMAIDMGNIVVHFLLGETRALYQIEKLWTLGHEFDDLTKEIQKYYLEND